MSFLVTKRNPQNEFEQFFEDFWSLPYRRSMAWSPAVDIDESADHFLVALEAPGMKTEDLKIEVNADRLVVSGERKSETKRGEPSSYSERRYGSFERSFTLPSHIDSSKIEADYRDGVLKIFLPKAETIKIRQIKIGEAGKSGFFQKLLGEKKEEIAS